MHARAGKLSPFQLYQFLLGSVPDADVCAFLRQLTFLPMADIAALEARLGAPGYAPNTAQRLLAAEVTRFVHGEPGLQAALAATAVRLAPCRVCYTGCLAQFAQGVTQREIQNQRFRIQIRIQI